MEPVKFEDRDVIERVFGDSENDYVTVLAISRRARQILDEYDRYADALEVEKASTIAVREYMEGKLQFHLAPADTNPGSK